MNFTHFPTLNLHKKDKESKIYTNYIKSASFINSDNTNAIFVKLPTKLDIALEKKKSGFVSEILFHGFNLTSKRRKLWRPKYQMILINRRCYI